MSFENVTDVTAVIASINGVTSGLGTAFDATLLGLVLAMALNFPMNALAKREDDNLNDVDAFCNEVLLPRLRDSVSADQHEAGSLADSLVKAVSSADGISDSPVQVRRSVQVIAEDGSPVSAWPNVGAGSGDCRSSQKIPASASTSAQ